MTPGMSESQLVEVGVVVRERLGLHFPVERIRDLEAGLSVVAEALGLDGAEAVARRIVDEPLGAEDLKTLAQALTVGETNFCRDPEVFRSLEHVVLPELIERRRAGDRRIRIWSAGCCTGEEPYTVAMIIRRVLPDLDGWNITLLATDVNPHFLSRARQGVYGAWSFRRTPEWMSRRHFTLRDDGKRELQADIREMVNFEYLNLAESGYPSLFNNTNAMDVVLCRNVLIYFDNPAVEQVIRRLRSCLMPGGWLALGRSERAPLEVDGLEPVRLGEDYWYRHREEGARPELRTPSSAPPPRRARATPFPSALQQTFESGEYGEVAGELLAYLREGNPSRSDRRRAMRVLAQACANLGRLEEAQNWCEKALSEDKLDPRLHYLLASVLLERNRVGEAETSLQRAVFADDRFVLAHFALGNLKRRFRDPGQAREHFRRALVLLRHFGPDEILPDSEGLTAGRLSEITEQALLQC